jgi:hypothetical protein
MIMGFEKATECAPHRFVVIHDEDAGSGRLMGNRSHNSQMQVRTDSLSDDILGRPPLVQDLIPSTHLVFPTICQAGGAVCR